MLNPEPLPRKCRAKTCDSNYLTRLCHISCLIFFAGILSYLVDFLNQKAFCLVTAMRFVLYFVPDSKTASGNL